MYQILLKDKQRDVSETETFQSSKLEGDQDETESLGAFSLETETIQRVLIIKSGTKPGRDLNNFSRFPIFCDETRPETC